MRIWRDRKTGSAELTSESGVTHTHAHTHTHIHTQTDTRTHTDTHTHTHTHTHTQGRSDLRTGLEGLRTLGPKNLDI